MSMQDHPVHVTFRGGSKRVRTGSLDVPFSALCDRDKLRVMFAAAGVRCQVSRLTSGAMGKSMYAAGRRFIFDDEGAIKSVIEYQNRDPPSWVVDSE